MPRVGRMFAAYTFLRLAVFVAVLVVLPLLGMSGLPAVLLAIVGSAVVSLLAFRRQRAQLAEAMERRAIARRRGEDPPR